MHGLGLGGYDPDSQQEAAVAFGITVNEDEQRIGALSSQGATDSGAERGDHL